jgi:glycosyltransferase involved in cell wall biosynthesis
MLVLADREDRPGPFVERMREYGVTTYIIPMLFDLDPLIIPRLARFIRSEKYQIVHTHLFHANFYGTWAARIAGVAHCFSTQHGYAERRDHKWWVALADRMSASQQKCIITISESLRLWLHKHEGLPLSKMETVYYGFDTSQQLVQKPNLSTSGKIIGTVGRLIPSKKFDILIKAMPHVLRQVPDAHLWVVGDGPERSSLARLAESLKLTDSITFRGYRSDAAELMRRFTVFAFPSVKEGFGMVLLEAMAGCIPIVACNISSIPEIVIHEKTGLLVEPESPKAMAHAILNLLENSEYRSTIGNAGLQRLKNDFTIDKMVQNTYAIYKRFLN